MWIENNNEHKISRNHGSKSDEYEYEHHLEDGHVKTSTCCLTRLQRPGLRQQPCYKGARVGNGLFPTGNRLETTDANPDRWHNIFPVPDEVQAIEKFNKRLTCNLLYTGAHELLVLAANHVHCDFRHDRDVLANPVMTSTTATVVVTSIAFANMIISSKTAFMVVSRTWLLAVNFKFQISNCDHDH